MNADGEIKILDFLWTKKAWLKIEIFQLKTQTNSIFFELYNKAHNNIIKCIRVNKEYNILSI